MLRRYWPLVPSRALNGSAVLCAGVVGVVDPPMSEIAVLASAILIGVGVFSSPECAASPSESSSFHAEVRRGASTSIWLGELVTSLCCRMANLLREVAFGVMSVVVSELGGGELIRFGIVCQAGSGAGPVVSVDCQVLPTTF